MSLSWQTQFLASIIPTIATNLALILLAFFIWIFSDGVPRESRELSHLFLASILRGRISFLASSHNCMKYSCISSLFFNLTPASITASISLSAQKAKPTAGIGVLYPIFLASSSYLQPHQNAS